MMEPLEENLEKPQTTDRDSDNESINPLENCRDFNRVNKSNLTVKANLLSLVSQDGILTIRNSKLRKQELPEETLCSENNVLDLVLDNGGKAIAWLNKSQSHMRKRSVERYANHQHGLVSSSFNYDEDISIIKEVSTSIVCPEILQEYKKLSHLKKNDLTIQSQKG